MPERVGGAARARTYGVAKNAAKHRGGAGGYSPLRAISVFRCTGVHTVAFKFFSFSEGPSLKRLGYRRLSLRDLNCAKGAEVVGKNWRALRGPKNARIGAGLFGRTQRIDPGSLGAFLLSRSD